MLTQYVNIGYAILAVNNLYLHHVSFTDQANGVFRFSDSVAQPDPYFSDYDLKIKGTGTAIVIDNGGKYTC